MDIIKALTPELDATGLPWTVVTRSKHTQVILAGKIVATLPLKGKSSDRCRRPFLNARAMIRRAARNPT